jgi:glycosyltransferase involved in cell wall biosynthesis
MRVAFLTSHPIQYYATLFKALAGQPGLDLEVLYCHNAAPVEQANAGFGVPFSWDVPLFEGYFYRFLRNVASRPSIATFAGLDTPEIQAYIRAAKYDAVVTNGWHYRSAWQAIWACWRYRVPVLVRSDSHLYSPRSPLKTVFKALPYRWFVSRLDGCLPVGRWSADYFLHYGARADRIHIVPHVVDSRFNAEAERCAACRQQLRKRWALDCEQVVFLFSGKFIQKKRPLDFVKAVQEASRYHARVAGLMVGDGPLRAECEALVRNGRLPIRFAGFLNQSEIAQAYIACDALVLPSDGAETWGLVVNEAMACGKPALVSDRVGCGPDLVITGQTGFIFHLGDVTALSALMIDGASRPGRLMAMGENARKVAANYSVPVAVDSLMRALNVTVGGR